MSNFISILTFTILLTTQVFGAQDNVLTLPPFNANYNVEAQRGRFTGLTIINQSEAVIRTFVTLPAVPIGNLAAIFSCTLSLSGTTTIKDASPFAGTAERIGIEALVVVGGLPGAGPCNFATGPNFLEPIEYGSPEQIVTANETFTNSGPFSLFSPDGSVTVPVEIYMTANDGGIPSAYFSSYVSDIAATLSIAVTYPTNDPIDLEINENLRLAQTSFDPSNKGNVIIIGDKPAHIEVIGKTSGLSNGESFEVRTSITNVTTGATVSSNFSTITKSNGNDFKEFISIPTNFPDGQYRVQVELDPLNNYTNEDNKNNNLGRSNTFFIRRTNLTLGFTSIECEPTTTPCYTPSVPSEIDRFEDSRLKQLLSELLPVTPNTIKFEKSSISYIGSSKNRVYLDAQGAPMFSNGNMEDILGLELKLAKSTAIRKIVGVVSQDYFPHHGLPLTSGLVIYTGANKTARSLLLKNSAAFEVLPHELLHAFGVGFHPEDLTLGYNNYTAKEMNGAGNLMTAGTLANPYWVPQFAYEKALDSLLNSVVDPEIFVVGGLYNKETREFSNLTVEYSETGQIIENDENPDLSIYAKDSDGDVVGQLGLSLDAGIIIERDGAPSYEVDDIPVAPFVGSFLYTDDIISFQFETNDGASVEKFYINSYNDIVDLIELNDLRPRGKTAKKRILNWLYKNATYGDNLIEQDSEKTWRLRFFNFWFRKKLKIFLKKSENRESILKELDEFTKNL